MPHNTHTILHTHHTHVTHPHIHVPHTHTHMNKCSKSRERGDLDQPREKGTGEMGGKQEKQAGFPVPLPPSSGVCLSPSFWSFTHTITNPQKREEEEGGRAREDGDSVAVPPWFCPAPTSWPYAAVLLPGAPPPRPCSPVAPTHSQLSLSSSLGEPSLTLSSSSLCSWTEGLSAPVLLFRPSR